MSSLDLLRRYVQPLADWARDGPENKRDFRAPPWEEFLSWARKLIRPHYWESLNRRGGMTMPQFVDDCVERVLIWARNNAHTLQQRHFTDVKLRWCIRRIAINRRISLGREMQLHRLESLDDYSEERWGRPSYRESAPPPTPESLITRPVETGSSEFPNLEEEFILACEVMPRFNRRLRPMKKMREMLALLHCLGRRIGRRKGFPGYWYVWRVLRRKKGHLPVFVRRYLQKHLPQVEYKVINSRLGFLRRDFANFLTML